MTEEVSGEQIRNLRLAAGMDAAVLARRVSLSTAQLLQLENDQHSLFYTPAIRRHAARKVLAHLSSQLAIEARAEPMIAPDPHAQAVFIPAAQLPGLVLEATPADPSPAMKVGELPIQNLTTQVNPAERSLETVHAPAWAEAGPQLHRPTHSKRGASWGPSVGWMALLIAAAVLSAWALLRRPVSSPVPPLVEARPDAQDAAAVEPNPKAVAELRLPPSAAPPVPIDAGAAQSERDLVALAPASSLPGNPAAPLSVRPDDATGCPDLAAAAPAIELPQAFAQGRAIHLASSVGQLVCVLDGSGKLRAHRLEPDQAKTITGPPPWTVQTRSLHKLQLFFQGTRLALPAGAQDRVQLVQSR